MLANVLEAAGIATVSLGSVLGQAERCGAPRMLYCEFPLGRPLGKPNDPVYQRGVLDAAFALLDVSEADTPCLATFADVITAEFEEPAACPVPPRFDPSLPPAVDEARGLRAAYNRSVERYGTTALGKSITADQVPSALEAIVRIGDGAAFNEAGLPGDGNLISIAADIRAYYEEAALALADTAVGARSAEAWFYEITEAGAALHRAYASMRSAGAPQPLWYYLMPNIRHRRVPKPG